MKKVIYVIIILMMLLMASSRTGVKNNMGNYGFTYEKLEPRTAIVVQIGPFYFGEGYEGSMRHFLIISLLVFILLAINYKYSNNKLMNRIVFLSLYGMILLIFDETLIRLTGVVILSIMINSYMKIPKSKNVK